MNDIKDINNWHALSIEETVKITQSNADKGLTDENIRERLPIFGENRLPEKKKQPEIIRFLKHFNDVLIYVLLVAGAISALLGHYTDTIVIAIVTVINAFIGYIQEGKAEKALEKIRNMLPVKAEVIRNGNREIIDASSLTLGDIVLLKPGSKVPADLRLISVNNLKIEESALTGESVSSDKEVNIVAQKTSLGDRKNMAYSSTYVTTGTATGVVVAIGESTEIGKINKMISEVKPMTTPLLRQTARFGKNISIIVVGVGVLMFLFGIIFRNYPYEELLMSIIGLVVAAIPEGLPAILSIILAFGVQRMADKKAIVRQLPSVETLGSVSVICTDKTGTLTKNEMTVRSLITASSIYQVTGTGYEPEGDILDEQGNKVNFDEDKIAKRLVNGFKLCNDAELDKDEKGHWFIKGEPTEGALITLFEKAGIQQKKATRIASIPFDSSYKYMAVLVDTGYNKIIYVKGAPDRLIDMCNSEMGKDEVQQLNVEHWSKSVKHLAKSGQRVIGMAATIVDDSKTTLTHEDLKDGLSFLGLAGIIDPPREEAIDAIRTFYEAGVRVKMITGDHIETAKAIGFEMGIGDGKHALQGKDLDNMTDEEFEEAVMQNDVFARTTPEHKLRLVNALQSNKVICAMTGDGVNDAPALKKADIGIAMGIKGTEVSKDAAKIVLSDDNFSTIASAVEEGRRVYDNLKKTILFILPTSGAEAFLIVAAILFGTTMPLTPVQILWVNMITTVTISLALAFEPLEKNAMKRPPRSSDEPFMSRYFIIRVLFLLLLIGISTLLISMFLTEEGVDLLTVRTITFNTIIFAQMFYLFNIRSFEQPAISKNFFANKMAFLVSLILIVVQLFVTYTPFMQKILQITPLEAKHWIYPAIVGMGIFIVIEIEKAITRRVKSRK